MTFLHPVPLSPLHTINLLLMYCPQNKKRIQLKIILYPCLQYSKLTRLNICQFRCTAAQFSQNMGQNRPKFRIFYAKNGHIRCPQGRGMLRKQSCHVFVLHGCKALYRMQNAEKILEILKYIINTKKNLKKTLFQRIDQNLA